MKSYAVLALAAGISAQSLVPTEKTLVSVVSSVVSSSATLSIVSQITDGQPQVPTEGVLSASAVATKASTVISVLETSVLAPPTIKTPPTLPSATAPFVSQLTGVGQGIPTPPVSPPKPGNATISIISQITDGQIQVPPTSAPSATMPHSSVISAIGGGSNATASIMPFNPNAAPAVKVSGSFFAFAAAAVGLCALVL